MGVSGDESNVDCPLSFVEYLGLSISIPEMFGVVADNSVATSRFAVFTLVGSRIGGSPCPLNFMLDALMLWLRVGATRGQKGVSVLSKELRCCGSSSHEVVS